MVRPATILVIDDNEAVLEWVKPVLGRVGLKVVTSTEGELGIKLVRSVHPDLVLLDMTVADVDGTAFLERLRSEVAPPRPIVIATSGFDTYEPVALERGAAAYLRKPYEAAELLAVVEAALVDGRVDPAQLRNNAARVKQARLAAENARDEVMGKARLDDVAFREQTRELTAWARSYFDVQFSFVSGLKRGTLEILAEAGGAPQIPVGCVMDPASNFCPHVINACARLLVRDSQVNPAWSTHAAASSARFYAGAPLLAPTGIALGTLCLLDQRPVDFHAEDLAVLAHFAVHVGRQIHALARGEALEERLFVAPRMLGPVAVDVLLDAAVRRAARAGAVVELVLAELVDAHAGLKSVGHELSRLAEGRRLCYAVDESGAVALVVEGDGVEATRKRTDAALAAFTGHASIRGAGATLCSSLGGVADIDRFKRTARASLALACTRGDGSTARAEA